MHHTDTASTATSGHHAPHSSPHDGPESDAGPRKSWAVLALAPFEDVAAVLAHLDTRPPITDDHGGRRVRPVREWWRSP